jgi:anti-anti-sigma factor
VAERREEKTMPLYESAENHLKVIGELGATAEQRFREELEKLVVGGDGVVTVDLSEAKYITSVCIGALVVLCIDLRSMGRRAQCVLSPGVGKTLDMVGLTPMLMLDNDDAAEGAA